MSDRATQLLARRGLPYDHPEVLADRVRRGLIPAAHVELAADVANWRDWPASALGDRFWRLYACDVAGRALAQVESPDPRSDEAVRVARRYAVGEASRAELDAARAAAEDAARAAARAAARSAAGVAARDAAWGAAWAAARDAAADAAWSAREASWIAAWASAQGAARAAVGAARAPWAARDAAWAEERDWQDRHLRCCLLLPTWPDWRKTK